MANVEKHRKNWIEEFSRAEFSLVPTRSRSARVVGRHIKNRRKAPRYHAARPAPMPQALILQFDGWAATPENLDRARARVRELNQLLEEAGVPFRLEFR